MVEGKNADASGEKRRFDAEILPWRQFKDWPSEIFIREVLDWIYQSGYPERHEALFRNKIQKDATFYILRPDVTIDGKKRLGDSAPCPMCTSNRFLTGSLVYLPSMQCVAFIGHCCADKKTRADAAREFRLRSRQKHEEDYLLDNLLLIPARLAALEVIRPAAIEARRLYRQFRRDASRVQFQLRQIRRNYGGRLILSEIIRGGEDAVGTDYVGPAGIKGHGATNIETREHDYGLLAGDLITVKNFDPVKELDTLIRQLSSIDSVDDDEQVLDFIVSITPKQRGAAVAIMETVDDNVEKLLARLRNLLSFFTRENAEQLSAYGTSPHNSLPFTAKFGPMHGRPCMVIEQGKEKCVMHVGNDCQDFSFRWPAKL